MKDEIKSILLNHGQSATAVLKSRSLLSNVIEMTSFLSAGTSLSQRYWHIRNDSYVIQPCEICKTCPAIWTTKGVYGTCSKSCNKKLISIRTKKPRPEEIPVCVVCGKPAKPRPDRTEFRKTCGNRDCIERSKIETNKGKYGVEHYVEADEFRTKYQTVITERYGSISNMVKNTSEKRKNTNLSKYGVESFSNTDGFKNRMVEISQKKYGTDHMFQAEEIKTKSKNTIEQKYGVDNPAKSKEIREKIRETNKNKYGSHSFLQSEVFKNILKEMLPEIIKKGRDTVIKKYGVEYYFQSEDYRLKMKDYAYTRTEQYKARVLENMNSYIGEEYLLVKKDDGFVTIQHKKCGNVFDLVMSTLHGRIKRNAELCKICNPFYKSSSSHEDEIFEFVSQFSDFYRSDKEVCYPYEIDMVSKKKNLCIEMNGIWWHSDTHKPKYYHKIKSDICNISGFTLLHVWEDWWRLKKEITKSIILGHLGLHNKLYARKCNIKPISWLEAKSFTDKCHIQGHRNFKLGYGLYYENNLVQIMTFSESKEGEWEIMRSCSELNTTIIGGFSRLLNRFVTENRPKKIVSFVLRDLFTGSSYVNYGFTLENTTEPGYYWVNSNYHRLSRNSCQKWKLLKAGFKGDTEDQIMKERGYHKIYNSGNLKFSKIL